MQLRTALLARFEFLEARKLLSAVVPTDNEQYMLELLNRARASPSVEAARLGLDLNEGLPAGTISPAAKQPLAMNLHLVDAARLHSQWMIDNDAFSHSGAGGSNPGQRMVTAGYGAANTFGWGENLAYRGQKPATPPPTSTTAQEHDDLFIDEGVDGRGHRTNIMASDFKEVGMGIATGVFQTYNALISTQDFGYKSGDSFLTGVAYDDSVTADNFYTPGEGLGGVTVTAVRTSDSSTYSATTWSTGGYSLSLPAGAYNVTASGGQLSSPLEYTAISIGSTNVKQDVRPGVSPPVSPPALPPVSPPASPPVSPPPPPPGVVRASVWNDTNGDGKRQKKEPGLPDQVVFIDADSDGVLGTDELSATTGADGTFSFIDLSPGMMYRVQLQSVDGWRMTSKGGNSRDVSLAGNKPVVTKPFGLSTSVVLGGTVFHDIDGNGAAESGEPAFKQASVFIDLNADGAKQANERAVRVAADGSFRINGVAPGVYTLGMKVGKKFRISAPADRALTLDARLPGVELLSAVFGVTAIS